MPKEIDYTCNACKLLSECNYIYLKGNGFGCRYDYHCAFKRPYDLSFTQAELNEAVKAEIESCAMICDKQRDNALDNLGLIPPIAYWNGRGKCANECGEAIRNRK